MISGTVSRPDVTLFLDLDGVIRDVVLSDELADEGARAWIGRHWSETVSSGGADKVSRAMDDARSSRVSAVRQITQCFPSGLELLMEYTAVRLGAKEGLIAIGRNLQSVADMQTRLIEAQQAIERDYWKLREVESRYRLLFQLSNEAVVLVRDSDCRIIEANPAAVRALGLGSQRQGAALGRSLLAEVASGDRDQVQSMLLRVHEQGSAPAILVRLGEPSVQWMVRASLMTADPDATFLLQLTPAGAMPSALDEPDYSIEELIARGPDGFVVIDAEGAIVRANRAFLNLVQLGAEGAILGESLGRWLGRPGADITVLLSTAQRHGVVRLFTTTIRGELGTDTEVELSAAADDSESPRFFGVLVRHVGRRLNAAKDGSRLTAALGSITDQVGKSTLRNLVKETVRAVEQHYVEAALDLTQGNRSAAAALLGLSRQSLYEKLNRYGLDNDSKSPQSGA